VSSNDSLVSLWMPLIPSLARRVHPRSAVRCTGIHSKGVETVRVTNRILRLTERRSTFAPWRRLRRPFTHKDRD
jgi:hypothetical protein